MNLAPPPRLRDGDLVAVVAPAGPVNPARLARGLDLLGGHLRLQVPAEIHEATGFLAGSDARRADELNRALRDPDVRAIIVARGGYGILRILPLLDQDALRRDPKPIVGFSDATALLSWAAGAGIRGIHGPVVGQLGDLSAADLGWLHRMLTDPTPAGLLPWRLTATGAAGTGRRDGWLVGGNLTLIAHLIATPWQVATDGAIVLLEDVGEAPYALDRYLTRIQLGNAFAGARGALVGDFTRCTDPPTKPGADDDPRPALAVIAERLDAAGLPALAGAPVGHGTRNAALPWGGRCTLDLDAGTVTLHDAAVA